MNRMKRIKTIKEFEFSIGGCFGDTEKLHIKDGIVKAWRVESLYEQFTHKDVQGKPLKNKTLFINQLNELQVLSLNKEYWKPVMDGTQWELKITYNGNLKKHVHGSNHYPDNFNELIKILNQFYPFEEVELLDWMQNN